MPSTYNDLYLDTRRALKRNGVDSAALEAREIVCCAADKNKEEFYRDNRLYATPEIEARVSALLQRRLQGEPVAYLVGEWEFFGLPLIVNEHVLIPRSDTEVLAQQAIDYLKDYPGARVLDLCTGSGCVGLAIASQRTDCRVVLADCSEEVLRVARTNARLNHLQSRIAVLQADALAPPGAKFDAFQCIVSNPPYIPTGDLAGLDPSVREYEPHLALDGGADGLKFYRAIAARWKEALLPGGRLLFELGIGEADAVMRLLRSEGFGDLELYEDTQGISRVIAGTRCTEI